ncbi:hypothetical protein HK102_004674, partial [Quaeritorhiza haematococci]
DAGVGVVEDGEKEEYRRRIAQLEEEVRVLREENEKQVAQTTKYKDRWDKLKESAKRKKAAAAAASASVTSTTSTSVLSASTLSMGGASSVTAAAPSESSAANTAKDGGAEAAGLGLPRMTAMNTTKTSPSTAFTSRVSSASSLPSATASSPTISSQASTPIMPSMDSPASTTQTSNDAGKPPTAGSSHTTTVAPILTAPPTTSSSPPLSSASSSSSTTPMGMVSPVISALSPTSLATGLGIVGLKGVVVSQTPTAGIMTRQTAVGKGSGEKKVTQSSQGQGSSTSVSPLSPVVDQRDSRNLGPDSPGGVGSISGEGLGGSNSMTSSTATITAATVGGRRQSVDEEEKVPEEEGYGASRNTGSGQGVEDGIREVMRLGSLSLEMKDEGEVGGEGSTTPPLGSASSLAQSAMSTTTMWYSTTSGYD